MRIIVNGRDMLVADKLTISELVATQGYNPGIIVVEYNKSIVNKQEWQTIQLQPEDCLEVISFVGGG
jgi:sulfur carrier protein